MIEINNPFKIAIASGKGGTGKTLLSTNLAAFLSAKTECLLVDLDVEEPNDGIFFQKQAIKVADKFKMIPEWVESKCTLCGQCSTNCKFHAVLQLGNIVAVFKELCHSCYACSELCPENALPMKPHKIGEISKIKMGDLTFIESRLSLDEEQAVPIIHQTHDWVANEFATIPIHIFDCPPGTSCPVVAATKNADFVILVTEPTPFGLNDLKLAVETMRNLKRKFGVVINRDGIGNSAVEDYCEFENIPILAKIAYDMQIALHYSKGELVYDKIPQVTEALRNIIENIPLNLEHNV